REAVEETGLEVELKSLKEVRKVTFEFSNAELERWHLLFEAEAVGGELEPKDKEEIEEVKLFEGEWYWSKGFYILRR
ncbi:MAG: NUDIX hydrolase, partial [Candidatus Natronoplasma sp.]